MKTIAVLSALLTLIGVIGCDKPAESKESFAAIVEKAFVDGEDANINVGFARVLGLKADQSLPLKRLQFEAKGGRSQQ